MSSFRAGFPELVCDNASMFLCIELLCTFCVLYAFMYVEIITLSFELTVLF